MIDFNVYVGILLITLLPALVAEFFISVKPHSPVPRLTSSTDSFSWDARAPNIGVMLL